MIDPNLYMNGKIKKLKQFNTATFAVWLFDAAKTRGLHSRVVIMGLNPSARITFGENFHAAGHQFDRWYKAGFSKPPFKGAYMTDLISHHERDSRIVEKKWKTNRFRSKNIKNLTKQFDILGVKNTTPILCIGQNTKRLFKEAFPAFKYVEGISAPNWYRYGNGGERAFLRDLNNIGKRVDKIIR